MSKHVTLVEQFQKQTFEALALRVPGGHFLIFQLTLMNYRYLFAILTVMAVVHALVVDVWFLLLEPHFYGELKAPDHT